MSMSVEREHEIWQYIKQQDLIKRAAELLRSLPCDADHWFERDQWLKDAGIDQ